jgi:hypothetical protein
MRQVHTLSYVETPLQLGGKALEEAQGTGALDRDRRIFPVREAGADYWYGFAEKLSGADSLLLRISRERKIKPA